MFKKLDEMAKQADLFAEVQGGIICEQILSSVIIGVRRRIILNWTGIMQEENRRLRVVFTVRGI